MHQRSAVKDLLNWKKWTDEEIAEVLDLAEKMKVNPSEYSTRMSGKSMVMIFQKTSTRTRVSFEAGMSEMGGHAIFMDWPTTNIGLSELRYESAYLSKNVAIMMARMIKYEDLLELNKGATIPLINGCCNRYHPCQALADILTIKEDRGSLEGAKLVYVGVLNNVANSLMSISAAFGVQLTLVCPIKQQEVFDLDIKKRIDAKGLLRETLDYEKALADAEYIYTDTWVDMEFFNDPAYKKYKEERIKLMAPYQINGDVMSKSRAKIMHPMPIHPGYEITDEMVNDARSIIFEQAGNRMHAQKAIVLSLLQEK